jgi:uncharacterized protein
MALKVTDKKFYRYIILKLMRQKGTPHTLALSVAIGTFFGFFIPVCQMFVAIFFAWIFKVNKIVSAACTWITNPVTIPIVFPFNVYLGSFFIKGDVDMDFIVTTMSNLRFSEILDLGVKLGGSGVLMFIIGGSILGSIFSPISYAFVYITAKKHRELKVERSLKKKIKRQKKHEEKKKLEEKKR